MGFLDFTEHWPPLASIRLGPYTSLRDDPLKYSLRRFGTQITLVLRRPNESFPKGGSTTHFRTHRFPCRESVSRFYFRLYHATKEEDRGPKGHAAPPTPPRRGLPIQSRSGACRPLAIQKKRRRGEGHQRRRLCGTQRIPLRFALIFDLDDDTLTMREDKRQK